MQINDIVLIASTREELWELVERLHSAAMSMRTKMNVEKTEVGP